MGKKLNASVIISRDGKSEVQNFNGIGYATFVAVQAALTGVVAVLTSWGVGRVAAHVDGLQGVEVAGGSSDLRLELRADHGDSGTSEFVLGFTGISAALADQVTGLARQAIAGVGASKP